MRRIGNSNILITIGIAVIVIPICCYLFILFSNSGVLSKMSFENILSKTRIEIPSVNCFDNDQKWLTGQDDDDYGTVFLKKDSIFFATFKEDDNPRKGYKYELINLSEIGDKLDKVIMTVSMVFSVVLAMVLFMWLPLGIAGLLRKAIPSDAGRITYCR